MINLEKQDKIIIILFFVVTCLLVVHTARQRNAEYPEQTKTISQEHTSEIDNTVTGSDILGGIDESINHDRLCFFEDSLDEYLDFDRSTYNEHSYYFQEFEIHDGRVMGFFESYPYQKDSLIGEYVGHAFYQDNTIILEVDSLEQGEGEIGYVESIYKYNPTTKEIVTGYGKTVDDGTGRYRFKDKADLSFSNPIPEVDCDQYNKVYESYGGYKYANDRKSQIETAKRDGLINYWGKDMDGNANFAIDESTIFYPSSSLYSYFYTLGNDENGKYIEIIYGNNFSIKEYYAISNDVLSLSTDGETSQYPRWCPEINDLCINIK